ncbi:DUF4352 domain-containing protein [Halorussus salinisoli]|uniref:DUF4352 domain-containing protein n=1 Tax=Halorussus salinisoli TaxID=2558242 RepID=UPI0010C19646|nr:DUF4352 domain-containing protein [Halorussus salinisoli]
MNRRKLLSLAGVATLPSLSGCQAFGSTLRGEPAEFEDVSLSGPSEVGVGESFSLSVSVTNGGGRSGDFADVLTVGDADAETKIRIRDVGASESRTVEAGPFSMGHAGHQRFRLAETGASHVVSAASRSLRPGERFELSDGPGVSVSEASFLSAVFYDAADGRAVLAPDRGSVLVAVEVAVETGGSSDVRIGPDSFDVADGEVLTGLDGSDRGLDAVAGLDGDPFHRGAVGPGETRSGWLLAEVPRARAIEGLQVGWNRTRDEPDASGETTEASGETTEASGETTDASDQGRDSIPEARWRFDGVELPRFEVTDVQVPAEIELGTSVTVSATVENTGSVTGTYRAGLERRYADETDWRASETLELEVAAGSRATWTTELAPPASGRARYRFRPGSASESVTVNPATRALAESFTTPDGATVRVDVGSDYFEGLLPSYIYDEGGNQTYRAPDGNTFAFVSVAVENDAAEPVAFPERSAFSVVADGDAYSVFHQSSDDDGRLGSPVEGRFYSPKSEYGPGETHSGWLVFQIPDDVPVGELVVRCSSGDDVMAEWSE